MNGALFKGPIVRYSDKFPDIMDTLLFHMLHTYSSLLIFGRLLFFLYIAFRLQLLQ